MRERTGARGTQITAIERLEQDLEDAADADRARRGRGRRGDRSTEGEAGDPRRSQDEAARRQVETLLSGEADGNDTYVEVHSGAGGTESQDWAADAAAHVRALGRAPEVQGRGARSISDGEEAGIKSATLLSQGPQRLWLAEDRIRRAPPRAHLAVRFERAPAHELRLRLGLSGGRRPHQHRGARNRTAGSTPTAPPAPAASTSTRPIRRCASRTSRPASSSPASRSARSTRTAPPPGTCCAPGSTSAS